MNELMKLIFNLLDILYIQKNIYAIENVFNCINIHMVINRR